MGNILRLLITPQTMNVFTRLIFATAVLLPSVVYSQQNNRIKFQVKYNIRGMVNDSLVIFINDYDQDGLRLKTDTIITSPGKELSVKANWRSKLVWAQLGGLRSRKSFSFFIENGKIDIKGDIDSLDNLSITGTPANNDQTASRRITNDIYNRIKLLRLQLKNTTEGSDEFKRVSNLINSKFDSIQAYELSYIKRRPNSMVSATYLYVKQDKLPVDELEELYNNLGPEVKKSDFGMTVKNKIKARRFVAVGNKAPEFSSTDTSGNTVRLSDFRGKYVLLEFWANWCVPCRQQSPHLIELHKKYSDKGFTILQYSIDDKTAEKKWKEAIRKDGLQWTQISDLAGFDSKVAKLYAVQPIPDNFLIDPNGVIIARGLEAKELGEKLNRLLNN
ncbi:MAG: resA 8 [Chitinophagaceae bacterium]|nr:resA 8 [Chitinophagaceae bacterium]